MSESLNSLYEAYSLWRWKTLTYWLSYVIWKYFLTKERVMIFFIPCGCYHVISCLNTGITTARYVWTTSALQWMAMDPSICATSSNRSRLQEKLIMDWMSNKIQVRGTPTLVMLKSLPLHMELNNRRPYQNILNPVSNPSKLAVLLTKDRFPELCVDSISIWVVYRAADSTTCASCMTVLSAL